MATRKTKEQLLQDAEDRVKKLKAEIKEAGKKKADYRDWETTQLAVSALLPIVGAV